MVVPPGICRYIHHFEVWLVRQAVIIYEYTQEVISFPVVPEECFEITGQFALRWQFPYSYGALDRNYVVFKCPNSSGYSYCNKYKGLYSIVLMKLFDADYKFIENIYYL